MTTEKTKLLTKIGYLFLRKMGCYEIATEIYLFHREYNWNAAKEKDCHCIIDILGIQNEWGHGDILRGIEVKVARSDLAKGFIQHGCTFHYLLMPKGLTHPSKVNRDIGIIEVDLPNFKMFTEDYQIMGGVTLTRAAKRKETQQVTIDKCKEQIGQRLTTQMVQWVQSELEQQVRRELNLA